MADRAHRWRPSPFLAASAGVHGVALATLLASPESWRLVVGALVGNHLAITATSVLPRCGWLGPNITHLPAARSADTVGLTFDDGPDPDLTPAVLDLLASAGARATFFCVGQRAEAHPELIAAILARGHGVENHTYSHPNGFAFRGPRGLTREILKAQEAIERSGAGRPRLFRAPAGMQNPWLSAVLARTGLSLVSWTRRGYDAVSNRSDRVAARLKKNLRAGDILLMHDGASARSANGRPVVLDALADLLDEMSRKGLRSEALHAVLEPNSSGPWKPVTS
ncbi:MAG: polysaccharide deacetylase family protein [Vicinamibacterales bacterium]